MDRSSLVVNKGELSIENIVNVTFSLSNGSNSAKNNNSSSESMKSWLKEVYMIYVPIFLLLCLAGMAANLCVLLTLRWIRGTLSATLRLTVSLAVADVYTSVLLAFSFIYNSYLWTVHNVPTSACVALTSEALRTGGLLTSTFHFLALALNHYLSTAHPFLYKRILTPFTTNCVIFALWLVPPVALLICFGTVPNQGYQSPNGTCHIHDFSNTLEFRLTIFVIISTLLIIMSALYIAVIMILRQMRQKFARKSVTSMANTKNVNQQLKRKRSTLITTLLIWGTFFVAWFPTALIYVLSCITCPFTPKDRLRSKDVFWVSMVAMIGILMKTLINPIIYAVRIPEISDAFRRQLAAKVCFCSKPVESNSSGNQQNGETNTDFRSVKYHKTEDEQSVMLLADNNNLNTVSK